MKERKDFALRHVAGAYWIIDLRQEGPEYVQPLTLNECGAFIWSRYMEGCSVPEIGRLLCQEYGIEEKEACGDVEQFLKQLDENGF